jgi:hypothetical protein
MCEKEGKFHEAQNAKKRLKELRKLEDVRKRDLLISRHVSYCFHDEYTSLDANYTFE